MGRISIQFHALPDELLEIVRNFVLDFDLHIVAMRFFPFEAIEVASDKLDDIFAEKSPYRELAFTMNKPVFPVRSNTDFASKNPDKLRLDIQRPTDKGLRQTMLSAHTDDPKALSVWKEFEKRLRKNTRSGVVVRNPNTGATGKNRVFRYSAGAKALASGGVAMLPIAGGNLIEFSEAEAEAKTKIQD